MTELFPVVITAFNIDYFLLPGGALILLALIWIVLQAVRKHYVRKHIWPSGIEIQNGMNAREAARHMRETGRRHSSVKLSRNSVISRIHWSIYLNLKYIRHQLSKVPADIILMIPASLWLFDNFYLLYKEVKKVQETGGTSRFRKLPVLTEGPGKKYPRIYVLAREIVASCSGHISEDLLFQMLEEYQKEQKLTTAELWAFQNVLSLCLLEKIIVESRKIITSINTKKSAASQLKKIMPMILKKDKRISELLRNTFTSEQANNHAFLAHIIIQLRALSIDDAELDEWLQQTAGAADNAYPDRLSEIVNQEGQAEAASETSISILISSLKNVGDLNWEDLFQKVSALDAVLCEDPADVFRQMDSETKGLYRTVIAKLSRKHHLEESDIARKVVRLASRDSDQIDQSRKSHVGYYLSGKGYYILLDVLSGSGGARQLFDKAIRLMRGICYFTGILAISGGLLFVCWLLMREAPEIEWLVKSLLLLLLVMPCSDLASFLMNRIFSRLIRPQPLPAMDYTKEIPQACTTFVVMPVITDNPEQIRTFAKRLEKHFLANRQKNIYYALLADYHDAASETTVVDDIILSAGTKAINTLNETYPETKNRFYLFFRPRKWNQAQGCWMGWERKRGKLESFNAYLCGEQNSGIDLVVGNRELMPDIRYVITLDADTELLRDGAAQLIGIMAHPMNKPVLDHQKNRITAGYAIVQSEIRTRILAHSTSLFARLFSGQTGIDPYASLVSDVYQDLFEEGIYVGKGIYDLQVFHQFLHGAIPENSVLSHDLLEGSLSRCAFASGIKLMDRCPESVAAYAKREHRWMRGDWQLLPWIFARSNINGLSRWKMIDNLRRSLVKPALLLLLIGNALLAPQQIWFGLFFISYEPFYRILTLILSAIWQKLRNPTVRLARSAIVEQISIILAQAFFNIVLLPYRSYLAIDASIRTIYRVLISHKNLLEWQTAEAVEQSQINKQGQYWRLMWMSLIPAAILSSAVFGIFPAASMVFWLVIALLWIISPSIAWVISLRKPVRSRRFASTSQVDDLRLTARKTWRYFEEQRTIENHWLCPDNVQLHPGPVTSLKTSPTNIGLQLLATLSARDFGYIGLLSLVEQCEQVIDTILSLPRWHGHLYNWYNIRTLQVLHPRYVSTVDSGNFVAHLIALKQGLLQQKSDDIIHADCIHGLNDTCRLAGWSKDELPDIVDGTDRWTSHLKAMKNARPAQGVVDAEWLLTVQNTCEDFLRDIDKLKLVDQPVEQSNLLALSKAGHEEAQNLIRRIDHLIAALDRIIEAVDFSILYDAKYQLFSIGYNVASQTADSGHYDLFASEARVASFIAIARSEVPQKHWFALGRPLTMVKGIPACVSWSGSMFEYLMPNLIMKTPQGTVMQQSCQAAVIQQIAYARRRKIPWGISESQYYRFDTNSNYQYSAFGIPRLRLQASLRPAKTVAPYATMLALAVLPGQSLDNLTRMRALGAEGKYGFYEALDFNQPDAGRLESFSIVRSFMTHHQGMSFVAINNFLNHNIMRYRFHGDPVVQSAETLLEEKRTGITVTLASRGYTINIDASNIPDEKTESRICVKTNLVQPLVHILSNARYMVMLTSDGAGLSRYDDLLITRWQPDTIHNQSGTFIYVRHLAAHQKWSAGYLPTQTEPDDYQVQFSHDRAEYTRRDGSIQTHTNITVSPVHNCEIRRITLTNHGSQAAEIELTSYLEVVADDYMADTSHPSFSKLFIETEYIADRSLLIACRRKRSPEDQSRFVMHAVLPESKLLRPVEFEIDRLHFIGRGGSLAEPAVIDNDIVMQNQAGFSRDTILSLRAVVSVPAGRSVSLSFVTGFCDSRENAMRLSHELSKPFSAVDTFALALASGKLELKYLNINSRQLNAILN
ncbi:MAG: glucoamylase family protein, partial [Bacillota bacterium]|nr:glucoamylase family protein [Bacillota bacterium]